MEDWVWSNCKFAIKALASVEKDLAEMGYYQSAINEFMSTGINNGTVIKQWIVPMSQAIGFHRVKKFIDYFRRKKEYKGKRDILQINENDILDFESDAEAKEENQNSYEVAYQQGDVVVYRAWTPQAAAKLSNCDQFGQNAWCTKGEGWSSMYMRPTDASGGQAHDFFAVIYKGKFAFAVIPSQNGDIKDMNGHDAYEQNLQGYLAADPGFQQVLDAIYWIMQNYGGGKWPQLEGFREMSKMFVKQKIDNRQFDQSFANAVMSMEMMSFTSSGINEKMKEAYPTLPPETKAFVKQTFQRQNINEIKASLTHLIINSTRYKTMTMKELLDSRKHVGRQVLFGPASKLVQTAINELIQEGKLVQLEDGTFQYAEWVNKKSWF